MKNVSQSYEVLPNHWLQSDSHWFHTKWTKQSLQYREYLMELIRLFNSLYEALKTETPHYAQVSELIQIAVSNVLFDNKKIEQTLFNHLAFILKESIPEETFLDFTPEEYLVITDNLLIELIQQLFTKNSNFSTLETAAWKRGKLHFHETFKELPFHLANTVPLALHWLESSHLFASYFTHKPQYFRKLNHHSSLSYQNTCLGCRPSLLQSITHQTRQLLCKIHFHWMRGFIFELNNQIIIEPLSPQSKNCTIQLFIHQQAPQKIYE